MIATTQPKPAMHRSTLRSAHVRAERKENEDAPMLHKKLGMCGMISRAVYVTANALRPIKGTLYGASIVVV